MKGLKIQPKEIPSDDCMVTIDKATGEKVAIHVGEWVRLLPIVSVGELLHQVSLRNDQANTEESVAAHWRTMTKQLSKRIVEWNWTDLMGEPLPCPYGQSEVLELLSDEELVWLVIHALNPETPVERKNA